MHELSLACNLVELAEAAARRAGAARVAAVRLRLGVLAGVDADALRLGYAVAVEGTLLAGARLEIDLLPLVVYCPACDACSTLDGIQQLACPRCGQLTGDLRQGRELEIAYLEAELEAADETA